MENGNYIKKIVNFDDFLVSRFAPSIYSNSYDSLCGCGAAALATLTGVNPLTIKKPKSKIPDHWPDEYLVEYLTNLGFRIEKLTKCKVTNDPHFLTQAVTKEHVMLASQLLIRNEASWSVFYKDYIFHNFSVSKLTPLEFVNHPILSAYLVTCSDWKV